MNFLFSFLYYVFLIFIINIFIFIIYYYFRILSTVFVEFINSERNNKIVQLCPILKGYYWPSPWVFNSHLQGVILMKLREKVDPCYRREILKATDGASLELDWGESDGPELSDNSPIICLLSGVTGSSSSSYITYLMVHFRKKGYRPVMMNYPNATGSPLTSPRFFCLDSVSDTKEYIEHVHTLYPSAPIIGIGFSLGGFFMSNYISVYKDNPLLGIMTISAPFAAETCVNHWKGRWVQENVYDKHFLDKFRGGFERNKELFTSRLPHLDQDKILKSNTMEELHTNLSLKLYNVPTLPKYYEVMSSYDKISNITIPTLVLHAWNDPVVPPEAIPVDNIRNNPNIIFVHTKTGGHTGWLTSLTPFKHLAWCEQLAIQYADSLLSINKLD